MTTSNGEPRPEAEQLLTSEQAVAIVRLSQKMGIDITSEGMREATKRVGGLPTPYGYLLLNRTQAHILVMTMLTFLKERGKPAQPEARNGAA